MSDNSTIEWTDATWNPVRGCVKISPGCKNCYAERFAERFRGTSNHPFEQGFDPTLAAHKLVDPIRWRSPRTIFVNSMSDLFQDDVAAEYVRQVVDIMLLANWHTYQVLTKRADRMCTMLENELRDAAAARHIWWGVSVEDKAYGVPRLERLRQTPAAMRFLSVEPLLENIAPISFDGLDWVIVGGESGPGCRPIRRTWVEAVRKQCRADRVPFFFKQWGGVRKKENGRTLNRRTYNEMPRAAAESPPSLQQQRELLAKVERSESNSLVVLRPRRSKRRIRAG